MADYSVLFRAVHILYPPLRRLQTDIRKRFECFLIRIQQRLHSCPFGHERLVFIQHIREQVRFIQRRHEAILHLLCRVVDKEVHDGFWDDILDRLPHDVEIRGDEGADKLGLHFFAHC